MDQVKKEEDASLSDSIQDSKQHYSSKSDKKEKDQGKKEEWKCLDCNKCYKSYPAFYTHNKLKHQGKPPERYEIPRSLEDIRKDRGRPRVTDTNQKIRFTIQDKHQQKCEDSLYEFLGRLGQKGDESGTRDNTVIRGYLSKPINPSEEICLECFREQMLNQIVRELKKEIEIITKALEENNQWEFIDPLDLKPDDLNEFSIFNLKALFHNITKKNMNNKYTTLSVFLIWISKELLAPAYKEVCIISIMLVGQYWRWIEEKKQNSANHQEEPLSVIVRKERQNYKEYFINNIQYYFKDLKEYLFLFSDLQDIKIFVENMVTWYFHFEEDQHLINEGQAQTHPQEKLEESSDNNNSNIIENNNIISTYQNGNSNMNIQISNSIQQNVINVNVATNPPIGNLTNNMSSADITQTSKNNASSKSAESSSSSSSENLNVQDEDEPGNN